jgi:nucleoside-diphosphate-sugar epimerase
MNNKCVDLFGGTGFIGSAYHEMFPAYVHSREDVKPVFEDILYMISTTDNYHIFDDLFIDVNTNLIHLLKVLNTFKDDKKLTDTSVFNFISSWFVYGNVYDEHLPVREDSVCKPTGFYSITKKCAEDLLISFCNTYDMKYRILRLCNVYGPNDSGVSKKKNALQYLLNEIKNNRDINLYYDGEFFRDYMHISDVCRAINLCVNCAKTNDIINIGTGRRQRFRDIVDFAIKETNSTSKINSIDAPPFHKTVQSKNMRLDNTKISQLGFKPEINIYDGIRQLLK